MSNLGLRSRLPPDSQPQFDPDGVSRVSDQEWEIRRAIYVLQNTFSHFFETGLVTSIDTTTGAPDEPSSSTGIVGGALKLPISSISSSSSSRNSGRHEAIYSPKIRLSYTPPVALPAPFPKTISIEGLPLYIASSTFVRHTLKALYTDLRVEIDKFVVHTSGPGRSPPGFFTGSVPGRDFATAVLAYPNRELNSLSSQSEQSLRHGLEKHTERRTPLVREKSLLIGLKVVGTARVSGASNQWDVVSTYTFSPLSGLILTHVIDSIHPAPHQAVYDSLRSNLGKVFGWNGAPAGLPRPAEVHPAPAVCRGTHGGRRRDGNEG
ncbi:hypothetical protein APHAL10511_005160 [Amanita phalloides]|nr:hypothetical protein APHAL10511_005160 [Amanita phalloides]